MKLAYERPIMRAELFRTNAYAEGCKRVVVGVNNLLKFVWNNIELLFSDKRIDTVNMVTSQPEYYFKEAADYDKTPNDTYFLEYSAQNRNFNLYLDVAESGYGRNSKDQVEISGVGTLQSAANSYMDKRWTRPLGGVLGNVNNNPEGTSNNWFYSDDVLQTDISFSSVEGAEMGMSF